MGEITRREAMKTALKTGAYSAPVILSVTIPAAVSAQVSGKSTANLALTKTVDNAFPIVGSNVTFTLAVGNNGPGAATGVVVNDGLPAGLTFVSGVATQGSYSSATGIWTIGALAVNQQVTLTLVATAAGPAGTARTNTAARTASSPPDPNPANDSASATVAPQAAPTADIEVTKALATESPGFGDNTTFQVAVRNIGPNDATGIVVSDPIPANLSAAMVFVDPGTTYNPATGLWTIGTLAAGQGGVSLEMTGTIIGNVTNTATRTASSPPDPNAANDSASVTVIVI